eukprot:m.362861 g.362861  ORF g.362861 m.362861 type:complete len:428 (-) comp19963_c0_seq5:2578-3861(-)
MTTTGTETSGYFVTGYLHVGVCRGCCCCCGAFDVGGEKVGDRRPEVKLCVVGQCFYLCELQILLCQLELVGQGCLFCRVKFGIDAGTLFGEVHLVLDFRHAPVCLFFCHPLLVLDLGHRRLFLRLDDRLSPLSLGLLFDHFLMLGGDEELCFFGLDLLKVLRNGGRHLRLCHAHGQHLQAWGKLFHVLLQGPFEVLVNLIKESDVHFLQGVRAAKLVHLVVNLIKDQRLIIIDPVLLDNVVHVFASENVDHLDAFKVDDNTSRCATRHIDNLVRLHGDLDLADTREEREHHVKPWTVGFLEQGTSPVVHANVSFVDGVKPTLYGGQGNEGHHTSSCAQRHGDTCECVRGRVPTRGHLRPKLSCTVHNFAQNGSPWTQVTRRSASPGIRTTEPHHRPPTQRPALCKDGERRGRSFRGSGSFCQREQRH